MEQKNNYANQEQFDISIEDFDALNGKHEFSTKYNENKKELLKEYRKRIYGTPAKRYGKIAVAAALLIIAAPVITNAATGGEFFNRIWGSTGKENIEPHTEVVYDKDRNTSYELTYPKQEFEDISQDKAEELIGDNISYKPVVKKIGDTKLSVLSFVHDGNCAVAELTLEKKGGVDALDYNKDYNETKGADFSGQSDFYFDFDDYSGKIYVDLDKSGKDMLYCYYYMTNSFSGNTNQVVLNIEEYPCTREELWNASDSKFNEYIKKTKKSTITVPVKEKIKDSVFVNKSKGTIEISPLSMKIDMKKGLGLSEDEAYDPYYIYYVSVNYKDGTKYIVDEKETEEHSCETDISNSSYACGDEDGNMVFVFNRLVDTNNIQSITVNKTEYALK